MSANNPERFPWGGNLPTHEQRLLVALLVAAMAATTLAAGFSLHAGSHSDFDLAWFGARSMLNGQDPYPLVGPGLLYEWPYHLLYPATSFVVALPLAFLSQQHAAILFVAISCFFLAYGSTRDSWHRLPLFASAAFFDSVMAAQWSIVLSAALFVPWLAWLAIAKPQAGIPVLVGSRERIALLAGVAGSIGLLAISLIFLPGWPREWWLLVTTGSSHLIVPIKQPLGFLILAVVIRWQRAESWLILFTACLPQTLMWYSVLVLLTVGRTYRQTVMLSMLSTGGYLLGQVAVAYAIPNIGRIIAGIMVVSAFLPAAAIVILSSNDDTKPAWLQIVLRRYSVASIK